MTEKLIIQQIITDWKTQELASDKKMFLSKVKASVETKNGEELMVGVKAISELTIDLRDELKNNSINTNPIEVFPNDEQEAKLISE